MPLDLKNKKCLCYDNGIFMSFAERLADEFGEVSYYNRWESGFPEPNDYFLATGYKNIKKVYKFWEEVDKADVICFFDTYAGDVQQYLRDKGYNVWGSGNGEQLEIMRVEAREQMSRVGLPVNNYERVKGFDSLVTFLSEKKDKYIKINGDLRGLCETFHFDDAKLSAPIFDRIKSKIAGYENDIEFLIDDPVPADFEPGTDTFIIDDKIPDKVIMGFEVKGVSYLGEVIDWVKYPKPMKETFEKMTSYFYAHNYRSSISTEERITKSKKSYCIDWCCRLGWPSSGAQAELISNWGEIIYFGAQGILVQPQFKARFAGELIVYDFYSENDPNAFYFPDKTPASIKFRYCLKRDGVTYTIPKQIPSIASIVAIGNSAQEIRKKIEDTSNMIKGYGIEIQMADFDKAIKAHKEGINFLYK